LAWRKKPVAYERTVRFQQAQRHHGMATSNTIPSGIGEGCHLYRTVVTGRNRFKPGTRITVNELFVDWVGLSNSIWNDKLRRRVSRPTLGREDDNDVDADVVNEACRGRRPSSRGRDPAAERRDPSFAPDIGGDGLAGKTGAEKRGHRAEERGCSRREPSLREGPAMAVGASKMQDWRHASLVGDRPGSAVEWGGGKNRRTAVDQRICGLGRQIRT